MIKKVIQQGRSLFDARSVLPVREHGKMARTPLAAFFNIPLVMSDTYFDVSTTFFPNPVRLLALLWDIGLVQSGVSVEHGD